jgi:hypothetical protein
MLSVIAKKVHAMMSWQQRGATFSGLHNVRMRGAVISNAAYAVVCDSDVDEETSLAAHVSCLPDYERASFTADILSNRILTAVEFVNRVSLDEWMNDCEWVVFLDIIIRIGAWVYASQENVETAALGHILRGTNGPIYHTALRNLVSRAIRIENENKTRSDYRTMVCQGPSYTAVYFSTIVSTVFKEMMMHIDAVHVLLRHPGPAHVESSWSPLSLLVHAPKESGSQAMTLLGHLEVLPLPASLRKLVLEYFLFTAGIVTEGISGIGRFVRLYTSPTRLSPTGIDVLPLGMCSPLVPELMDEETVFIEAPDRRGDCWVTTQVRGVERRRWRPNGIDEEEEIDSTKADPEWSPRKKRKVSSSLSSKKKHQQETDDDASVRLFLRDCVFFN